LTEIEDALGDVAMESIIEEAMKWLKEIGKIIFS
jgi:hypothetical protein